MAQRSISDARRRPKYAAPLQIILAAALSVTLAGAGMTIANAQPETTPPAVNTTAPQVPFDDECDPDTTTTPGTTTPMTTPAGVDPCAPTADTEQERATTSLTPTQIPASTATPATSTTLPASATAPDVADTTTPTSTPEDASPAVANGEKIPYTGKPTENPNNRVIPGKMRSDREELPGGYTKEEADQAEIEEAKALRQRATQRGAAPTDCQVYWPEWRYTVCGLIRVKYDSLGGPLSFLLLPASNELTNPDGHGKRSLFVNGPIYWSASSGAHPVVNHFHAAWGRQGYEVGILGYPTTDEIVLPDGVGRRQEFQGAAIYWRLNEAYAIGGAIRDKWNSLGAEQGPLAYPTTDEVGVVSCTEQFATNGPNSAERTAPWDTHSQTNK